MRWTAIAGGVLAAGAVLAAGEAPARDIPTATVRAKHVRFTPHVLTVRPRTRVTWRFLDEVTRHNVTSRGEDRFTSSEDYLEGSYAVTFRRPGVYRYECTVHPNMKGRVVVTQ